MARHELSDFKWNVILLLLPAKSRGRHRVYDRHVLSGIVRVLRAEFPGRISPSGTAQVP